MMDRKTYMRDIYSNYWITAREKIYGFSEYDKRLCEYICDCAPNGKRILEVAIGTGYPFADFLQKSGYLVYGIDISPALVEKCYALNPNIQCQAGDSENLEFPDQYFELVYCFHSTWYFPDIEKAIDEMLRVTRSGGIVMFDVQNLHNKDVSDSYCRVLSQNNLRNIMLRYIKNMVKIILRRSPVIWGFVVHETPTLANELCAYLRKKEIKCFYVMSMNCDGQLETRNDYDAFKEFPRLVFVLQK